MAFERTPELLQELARSVAGEPAIRAGMTEVKYEDDELASDIEAQAGSIWEVASDEIRRLEQSERELERLQAQAEDEASVARPAPADMPSSAAAGLLAAALGLYIVVLLGWGAVRLFQDWHQALPSLWNSILLLVPLAALGGLFNFFSGREDKRRIAWETRQKALGDQWESKRVDARARLGVDTAQAALTQRSETIGKVLRDRVKQVIVEAINARKKDSFDVHLQVRRPRGFGEVFNARFAVQTRARGRLQRMLETMPGGSIGIAGARGAGKSTLLKLYCGPRRIVERLKGRPVLGVLVSAPVVYQAREFILYLFSTICQQTIEAEGERYVSPAAPADAPVPRRIDPALQQFLRPVPLLLLRAAFWLLLLGVFLAAVMAALQSAPATSTPTPAATAAPAGPASVSSGVEGLPVTASGATAAVARAAAPASVAPASAAFVPSPKSGVFASGSGASAPASAAAAPASQPAPQSSTFLLKFLELLRIDPATWLGWAIALLAAGSFLAEALRQGAFRMYRLALAVTVRQCFGWLAPVGDRASRVIENAWEQIRREEERRRHPDPDSPGDQRYRSDLAIQAANWMKLIKFQQSYTSGWSGALKLPIGLEGGINRAVTLAQNQLSLPEIVHFLAEFIEKVSGKYQVIIGMDELDKLQSDDQAQQFLNDVKAIFGLEQCFYLITVSEDAMTSFERRGLKFRDVFDSAFDDFLYVEHLDFATARTLLQQRVVGRPVPFFALSYCMSGGLPRDLIRSFREVMEAGAEPGSPADLDSICGHLVREDLRGKVRAMRSALRKSSAEASAGDFPDVLYEIEEAVADDVRLAAAVGRLSALVPVLVSAAKAAASDKPAPADPAQTGAQATPVVDLVRELATYLCFGVTLRQFFTDRLTETMLTQPSAGASVDALSKARRVLGANPTLARMLIDTFRSAHSMPKFPPETRTGLEAESDETTG